MRDLTEKYVSEFKLAIEGNYLVNGNRIGNAKVPRWVLESILKQYKHYEFDDLQEIKDIYDDLLEAKPFPKLVRLWSSIKLKDKIPEYINANSFSIKNVCLENIREFRFFEYLTTVTDSKGNRIRGVYYDYGTIWKTKLSSLESAETKGPYNLYFTIPRTVKDNIFTVKDKFYWKNTMMIVIKDIWGVKDKKRTINPVKELGLPIALEVYKKMTEYLEKERS